MKERWRSEKATEPQEASDRKDLKAFYAGLMSIFGPQKNVVPISTAD